MVTCHTCDLLHITTILRYMVTCHTCDLLHITTTLRYTVTVIHVIYYI